MFTVSSVPKSPGLAEKGILMWAGSCFPWKNNCCQEEFVLVAEIEGGIERDLQCAKEMIPEFQTGWDGKNWNHSMGRDPSTNQSCRHPEDLGNWVLRFAVPQNFHSLIVRNWSFPTFQGSGAGLEWESGLGVVKRGEKLSGPFCQSCSRAAGIPSFSLGAAGMWHLERGQWWQQAALFTKIWDLLLLGPPRCGGCGAWSEEIVENGIKLPKNPMEREIS